MINLEKLLIALRFNQSKVARFLGINRLTLRNDIKAERNYLIVDGVVYKSIGKARMYELSEIEKLKIEEQYNRECGQ